MKIQSKAIAFSLTMSLGLIFGQSVRVTSQNARSVNVTIPPTGTGNQKSTITDDGLSQAAVKLKTTLVNLQVAALDPDGRFVWGLSESEFEVYQDGVRQKIAMFSEEDTQVSIGFVYDASGSMKYNIRRAQQILQEFVDASNKTDEFFLIGFRSSPEVLRDFTTDGSSVANAVSSLQSKGNTALYDAIYLALEKEKQSRYSRRAIVIISDGEENHSRYHFKELATLIQESDIQLYAIGVPETGNGLFGSITLKELVSYTGGHAFFPGNKEDLENDLTRIALELRHQYLISFIPQDARNDGRWHKIEVRISQSYGPSHLVARARNGYFAQAK